MLTRWEVADDGRDWLKRALAHVRAAETDALERRGVFHLVLAGGTTPARLYTALADEAHDWLSWQVWFGDERCLPPDHPERNSRMARETWLDRVGLPPANVHVIPAELGPDAAAAAYIRELAGVGDFDLVLLGLGEDGHTASLFPGREWGNGPGAADVLPVLDAPKPPPKRVSLSAMRLSRARRVLFLVTGSSKRNTVAAWRRGDALPAAAIRPDAGVDVLLDKEAWSE
ncbi:MAG: 6-phosphogluconolactonase [Thiobacillaceae bacterium]